MIATLKSDADIVFLDTADDVAKLVAQVESGDTTRKFLVVNYPNFHPMTKEFKALALLCRQVSKRQWTILIIHGYHLDKFFKMSADGEVLLRETVL